jgi:hypothetical protein
MFGFKVLLPCNPLNLIKEDYGANWSLPVKSNFGWGSLNYGDWKVYDKEKWPETIKYYFKNGKLDVNASLNDLNKHIGENGLVETSKIIDDLE